MRGCDTRLHVITLHVWELSWVLLLGQVTWKECLSNNAAWDTLTWFAALIGMASYLNKYGFIKWFSGKVSSWAMQ